MKLFKKLIHLAIVLSVANIAYGASGKALILDVRTPDEYAQSHVEGALNIDYLNPKFKLEAGSLDRGKEYVVYCRSGNRSQQAVKVLKDLGFKNLLDLGSAQNASTVLKTRCVGKTDRCM